MSTTPTPEQKADLLARLDDALAAARWRSVHARREAEDALGVSLARVLNVWHDDCYQILDPITVRGSIVHGVEQDCPQHE